MKFTLSWLKDHLETDASIEALADKLSSMGLEVESVVDPAKALEPFRIAKVLEAKQHPNADRLRVVQVDAGAGVLEVVSPAPRSRSTSALCAASSRTACSSPSANSNFPTRTRASSSCPRPTPTRSVNATPTSWASPIPCSK
jgi:hypothetical protein